MNMGDYRTIIREFLNELRHKFSRKTAVVHGLIMSSAVCSTTRGDRGMG
jgi:hypothetical protein